MPPDRHSRRDALKMFGAGAAACGCTPVLGLAPEPPKFHTLPPAVNYFGLRDVRLGKGPFLRAQELDAAYLLRLEPDRMLHNFRVNAGLQPKAPVYGGWESVEPWVDIRCHGHTLGHYLTAVACMHESSGDARFAGRADYIVSELAECQAKTGGWLTAFPDGVAPLTDSLAGKPFAGVPWYTTHKVLAGLRDTHLHLGSQPALKVLAGFAEWIYRQCATVPDERLQKMLDREHGGMNEVLVDVAVLTGDQRFLDLALRFSHRALLEPLAGARDTLDGLHANTQIPKVIGFSRISETTAANRSQYERAAKFFWRSVVVQRSFVTGGHGDVEHFFPVTDFEKHLGSAKTMETCCTHNMLRLTRALYAHEPQASYFNYYERALYNGILASQDPDSGMMTYFQSTRPGYVKLFHTPFDSFWCCTGSGVENHARYGESIYAHDGDSLYVNLFMASTLNWRERGFTLTQTTNFPDEDRTTLKIGGKRLRKLALRIRHPAWCERMTVVVNGNSAGVSSSPGSYFTLGRSLRPGDTIDVHLPTNARIEPLPGAPEYAALMYGPVVLAGIVGNKVDPAAQLIVNERKSGEMLNEPVEIPAWPHPLTELPAHLFRADAQRLEFDVPGFTGGPVKFIPWFRIAHERYNLYWRRSG